MAESERGRKQSFSGPAGSRGQTRKRTGSPRETTSLHDIYRAIFDNVNDGIILRDLKTKRILDVNRKFCEMTGYTAGEIKSMAPGWFGASPVQDGKTVADHHAEAARGKPQLFAWQGRKKDGTLFWVESNTRKVTTGGSGYLLSVIRDITERRRVQEALKESEARYRSVVEDETEFSVCRFRADGTVLLANGAFCRYFGVRKDELAGWSFWPLIAKEDREKVRTYLSSLTADNPAGTIEHRVVGPNSQMRWLLWSTRALFKGHGGAEFQAIGRDITARRMLEERIRESRETIRALFDAVTEPMALLDASRNVLALNKALAESMGKTPREVVGTPIDAHVNPELIAGTKEHADFVMRTGKPVQFVSERDGRYFEDDLYPVFNGGGKAAGVVWYAKDVTAYRQAQSELEAKSRYLKETNAALQVLLDQRDLYKKEVEDHVLSNAEQLILPAVEKLRAYGLSGEVRAFLDVVEAGVKEIVSPFTKRLAAYRFTPRELEVISLVREGRSAKEIAGLLSVCTGVVDTHKHHIRKKLGIGNAKGNLRSHLLRLAPD